MYSLQWDKCCRNHRAFCIPPQPQLLRTIEHRHLRIDASLDLTYHRIFTIYLISNYYLPSSPPEVFFHFQVFATIVKRQLLRISFFFVFVFSTILFDSWVWASRPCATVLLLHPCQYSIILYIEQGDQQANKTTTFSTMHFSIFFTIYFVLFLAILHIPSNRVFNRLKVQTKMR